MEGVLYPDAQQAADLTDYAINDVCITARLVVPLLTQLSNPAVELRLMMQTVRLFTEGGIAVDMVGLHRLKDEVGAALIQSIEQTGLAEEELSSDSKFAAHLQTALARSGRNVPTKKGKSGANRGCQKVVQALFFPSEC